MSTWSTAAAVPSPWIKLRLLRPTRPTACTPAALRMPAPARRGRRWRGTRRSRMAMPWHSPRAPRRMAATGAIGLRSKPAGTQLPTPTVSCSSQYSFPPATKTPPRSSTRSPWASSAPSRPLLRCSLRPPNPLLLALRPRPPNHRCSLRLPASLPRLPNPLLPELRLRRPSPLLPPPRR